MSVGVVASSTKNLKISFGVISANQTIAIAV